MRLFLAISLFLYTFSISAGNNFPVTNKYKAEDPAKKSTLSSPDFPGWLVLDIGFNSFIDNDAKMDIGFISSKSFGIYHMKSYDLGKKFAFNGAIGIASEKYGFKGSYNLDYAENPLSGAMETFIDSLTFSPSNNKLAVTYIDLPLEFRFYPANTKNTSGFFVALGGSVAYRVNAHTKVAGSQNGREFTTKIKDDFGLNSLRYGVTARLGFRGVSFYYKQFLSPFFKDGEQPRGTVAEPRTSVIGLSFALF